MSIDQKKYYEPLKLMIPIRHQYIRDNVNKYKKQAYVNYFKDKKILDIGTGTGEYLFNFKELKANCTGIDQVKNFKNKNSKNYKLINIDIFKYLKTVPKGHFDVIFCFEVIEHIKKKDIFFKLVKNALKKKGLFFLSTINRNYLSKILLINVAENFLKIVPKKTHDHELFLKIEELKEFCIKYNLNIKDITGLSYNPLFKNFRFTKNQLVNYITIIEN